MKNFLLLFSNVVRADIFLTSLAIWNVRGEATALADSLSRRRVRRRENQNLFELHSIYSASQDFANFLSPRASLCEAKTAKEPGRTKFAEMLSLLEQGKAEGILAWHPDRLARNSIDGGKIIYLLDTGKIKDLKFPTFWFENTP